MKPKFTVYPEQRKKNQINFPSQGCSLRKPLLQELALLNSQLDDPALGWLFLWPAAPWWSRVADTLHRSSDHWQSSWWVSSPHCSHILHAGPQEVPGCLEFLGWSPTKHTLLPCALQFLQPISVRASPADVLRQQSLRKLVHTTGQRAV